VFLRALRGEFSGNLCVLCGGIGFFRANLRASLGRAVILFGVFGIDPGTF